VQSENLCLDLIIGATATDQGELPGIVTVVVINSLDGGPSNLSGNEIDAGQLPRSISANQVRQPVGSLMDLARLVVSVGMLIVVLVAMFQQSPALQALIPILAAMVGYLFGGRRPPVQKD